VTRKRSLLARGGKPCHWTRGGGGSFRGETNTFNTFAKQMNNQKINTTD
jgi:hypothetical protein